MSYRDEAIRAMDLAIGPYGRGSTAETALDALLALPGVEVRWDCRTYGLEDICPPYIGDEPRNGHDRCRLVTVFPGDLRNKEE